MQSKLNTPFEVEKKRDKLAKLGLKKDFEKLYSSKNPQISNNNTVKMWDRLNSEKNLLTSNIYKDKISIILNYLSNKSGKLLDVGFGNGYLEKKLNNFELYGIDTSKKSVQSLNNNVRGTFKVGSILNIPSKEKLFDYILCLDVLEHISPDNLFSALAELNRVLKHGGVLIVSVPLNERLEDLIKKGSNPNAHVRVYTPSIIKMELELSGFKIENEFFLTAFKKFYKLKKTVNLLLKIREYNLMIVIVTKK